jgi:hypothetical protein
MLLILGCSSGSGNPQGMTQSGGSTCDAVCQKGVSLQCGDVTSVSDCTNECNAELSGDECGSLSLGLTMCAFDKFGCGFLEGEFDAGALLQACGPQSSAYLGCQACQADTGDSACETCEKTSCCAERKAMYENPDMAKFTACLSNCADTACQQNCAGQYPSLGQYTEAVQACTTSKCQSACSADGSGN